MINIAIDGNYIFHKTFGIFGGYGNVDPSKILNGPEEQASFIRKISTDMCSSIRKLPYGGKIVFTIDSRSWRKDIEIKDGGYKSNRKKDENVDWSIFYDLMNSYGAHLEKMGFILSKVDGAEGDDLLWKWSEHFNSIGENCIVVTGDGDLNQLANINDIGNWTIVWNPNSKKNVLTIPPGWLDKVIPTKNTKEMSIFDMGSSIIPHNDKLETLSKEADVIEVNVRDFIIEKILTGDKGDAVPSVWIGKNSSGKETRITPLKAKKIMDGFYNSQWGDLDFNDLLENDEFLEWTGGFCIRSVNGMDTTENRKEAGENLIRNFKLMWLNESVIPSDVLMGMEKSIDRGLGLARINPVLDRIKILDGTDWLRDGVNITPTQFNPFELMK
jgi:5'-3' exonuclease